MPYKFKRDCPVCGKPELLSLSDHLRQVHRLKSHERKQWLKAAVFSGSKKSLGITQGVSRRFTQLLHTEKERSRERKRTIAAVKETGKPQHWRKRLQTNPSILKTCVRQGTRRLIGSASRTMLTCVDQRFVSYWEDGMVRYTYINFQWLLFILVGKIFPPIQEHFLWPLLKRKAVLATE